MTNPAFLPAPNRATAAEAVAQRFRETYGYSPAGVWSAPGRVNLIGEHVDYSAGLCLPLALQHRTFVALSRRTDGSISVGSAQQPGAWSGQFAEIAPGARLGWAGYVAGVAWAMQRSLPQADGLSGGFDAMVEGSVPLGSGLSSSAALQCAVALALADQIGLQTGPADQTRPDNGPADQIGPDNGQSSADTAALTAASDAMRVRLAAACMLAENEIAGAATGGLDQAAALRCTAGSAMLLDCLDGSAAQVPLPLDQAGLTLLVINTRAEHSHAGGEYGQRRASVEAASARLGVANLRAVPYAELDASLRTLDDERTRARVRHTVTEIHRVEQTVALLRAGQINQIGALLDASHESLRVDFEVSCAELDLAVSSARRAGAIGARMTGGGFGGSAIALVEASTVEQVAKRIDAEFIEAGLTRPQFLTAVASPSAARDL